MGTRSSNAYIAVVLTAGAAILCHGLWTWHCTDPSKYLSYLLIAMTAAGMKIRLPTVTATMSVTFLFLLIGISELSLAETPVR
jgi:hypothetical protein